MIEIGEVRRRLLERIAAARRDAGARRARAESAHRAYEKFLRDAAAPVARMLAMALKAEGHPFQVFTPEASLRLASDGSHEDFIELVLDASSDPPVVLGRVSRARGSRRITSEAPIRENVPIERLTDQDVLDFFLRELTPFLEPFRG